jgi:hypothetical protein
MLPLQAQKVFGFDGHLPRASVQNPPAPSGAPQLEAPLQSGVLHAPW